MTDEKVKVPFKDYLENTGTLSTYEEDKELVRKEEEKLEPIEVKIINQPKEEPKNPTSEDTEDIYEIGLTDEMIEKYQEDIDNA